MKVFFVGIVILASFAFAAASTASDTDDEIDLILSDMPLTYYAGLQ